MASRSSRTKKSLAPRPLISPSLTSLLSSFTQTSTGSSGSSSTITQESVPKTRHRPQRKSEKRSSGHVRRSTRQDVEVEPSLDKGRLDVFAYMEEEEEEEEEAEVENESPIESIVEASEPPQQMTQVPPEAPMSPTAIKHLILTDDTHHVPAARASSIASLHSDSGISVRGPSRDRQPNPSHKKSSSRSSIVKNASLVRTRSISSTSSSLSHDIRPEDLDDPESFYTKTSAVSSPEIKLKSTAQQVQVRRKKKPVTEKNGYDLLASNLSTLAEDTAKPVYRRFETLNNRILLIMQDEIVTMEADLAMIDQQIAQVEGLARPASRRSELRAPTPLQWQRMQLCGMLITKLGQYNRTLASYQSVAHMSRTSEEQIQQYKDLLEQHQPLVSSEMAFLDEIADLVTVSAVSEVSKDQQKISYELCAAVFFLILAFKLIPSILGRLVLGGAVVSTLVWSGRLPLDGELIAGTISKKAVIYVVAMFALSIAVG